LISIPVEWWLDGFALVQSAALPQGSRYEIRKSWKVWGRSAHFARFGKKMPMSYEAAVATLPI
jgi:hypothetical protein